MGKYRFTALMLAAALLTGTLFLLTAGCDEDKDDYSSLLMLLSLNQGPKRIFITAAAYNGNLGGVSGADAKCMSDANKPSGGTWKAMVTGSTRSITSNWVLKPDTQYTRVDGTIIGTTNDNSVFTFPLDNAIRISAVHVWTGLKNDWSNSTDNCVNWTSNGGTDSGTYAKNDETSSWAIFNGADLCNTSGGFLYCVEQ